MNDSSGAVEPVEAAVRRIFETTVAHLPLLVTALVVVLVFVVLAWLLRGLIRRATWIADPSLRALAAGVTHATVIVLGVFVALWIAIPSVRFTELLTSLGVTGLILGFALRDIIENFVAGILILARRPFVVGDQIRSGEHEGTVEEVNFRSTVLHTYDGVKVLLPNGQLLTEPLENLTGYGERRSEISLGIHQDAPVDLARRVILATLDQLEEVLPEPAPMVLLSEVAESTNELAVTYWSRPPTRLHQRATASLVTQRLYDALRDNAIELPYPIQTVQLVRPSHGGRTPTSPRGRVPDSPGADLR
jgi:small-conductance mechanosensitive channel